MNVCICYNDSLDVFVLHCYHYDQTTNIYDNMDDDEENYIMPMKQVYYVIIGPDTLDMFYEQQNNIHKD